MKEEDTCIKCSTTAPPLLIMMPFITLPVCVCLCVCVCVDAYVYMCVCVCLQTYRVFLGSALPAAGGAGRSGVLDDAILDRMRREFSYWYPVDLRVSGMWQHTVTLYNLSRTAPV